MYIVCLFDMKTARNVSEELRIYFYSRMILPFLALHQYSCAYSHLYNPPLIKQYKIHTLISTFIAINNKFIFIYTEIT